MDLNRNHYFITGVVLFLLGLQFRYVSSFELNAKSTQFLEKRLGVPPEQQAQPQTFMPWLSAAPAPPQGRVIRPPKWIGWSLMSVGAVLFIYSLSMRKPGT